MFIFTRIWVVLTAHFSGSMRPGYPWIQGHMDTWSYDPSINNCWVIKGKGVLCS